MHFCDQIRKNIVPRDNCLLCWQLFQWIPPKRKGWFRDIKSAPQKRDVYLSGSKVRSVFTLNP